MNSVNLIGRVVKDIELKQTNTNKVYCFFNLAVNEYFNGNQQTHFIPCIAWEQTAKNLSTYIKKGNQIAIEGSIQVRQENNNGNFTTIITIRVLKTHFIGSPTNKNEINDNNIKLDKKWDNAQKTTGYQVQPISREITKEDLFNDDEDIVW